MKAELLALKKAKNLEDKTRDIISQKIGTMHMMMAQKKTKFTSYSA